MAGVLSDLRSQVKSRIQEAISAGCKFVVQADCWKPKMRKRRHYFAVIVSWVSPRFEYEEVCVNVMELGAPRTGEAFRDAFIASLAKVCLPVDRIVAGASDHERSLRKGLRLLGVPLVGCGCHALALVPKHILPLLRTSAAARISHLFLIVYRNGWLRI